MSGIVRTFVETVRNVSSYTIDQNIATTSSPSFAGLNVSGNVGIGTSSPIGHFGVSTGAAGSPQIVFDQTSDDPFITLNRWIGSGTNYYGIRLRNTQGDLTFHTTPSGDQAGGQTFTERMRLTNTGNLGVGTSSPSSKLDVVVADAVIASKWISTTGRLRLRPYVDATVGALFESTNAAESAYFPLSLYGSTVRIGNGAQVIIDASGNLGLGVTPSGWGAAYRTFESGVSGNNYGVFWSSSNGDGGGNSYGQIGLGNNISTGSKYAGNGASSYYAQSGGRHSWYTAPSGTAGNAISFTQAMTLDGGGNLMIGTTTPNALVTAQFAGLISIGMSFNDTSNSGTTQAIVFRKNTSSQVGSIQTSTTATNYVSTSDYRLKDVVGPLSGLATILALKPVVFTWKVDGSLDRGFIAHELQEVIPQAVSGEKDAINDDGSIKPQGVDYGRITPEIVAAIQEQQKLINELREEINILKSKIN